MITYKGRNYETRQITICPHDVAIPVTVAREELWNAIKHGASRTNSEEFTIDHQICFYCNDQEWAMDDAHLANMLESL